MLSQLANLHHQNLVFKYLTPKSVVVVQGLRIDEAIIKLRISNIAMMQLIDVPEHLSI